MATENLIYALPDALSKPIEIVLWIIGAAGIFVILYIIFGVINTISNRKRNKKIENLGQQISEMNSNLEEIKNLLAKKR